MGDFEGAELVIERFLSHVANRSNYEVTPVKHIVYP